MTNQAAQTMPVLPRPYWKAGEVKDDFGNPYNETDLFTDDDMRAMYKQGYAAALSQPAGVAQSSNPNLATPGLSSESGASVSERARAADDIALSGCEDCATHKELRRLLDQKNGIIKRLISEDDERFSAEQRRALSSPRQEGDSTAASTQGLREAAHAFLEAADARDNEETATQYPDHGLRLRQYKAAREDLESILTSPTTGADGVSLVGSGGHG